MDMLGLCDKKAIIMLLTISMLAMLCLIKFFNGQEVISYIYNLRLVIIYCTSTEVYSNLSNCWTNL